MLAGRGALHRAMVWCYFNPRKTSRWHYGQLMQGGSSLPSCPLCLLCSSFMLPQGPSQVWLPPSAPQAAACQPRGVWLKTRPAQGVAAQGQAPEPRSRRLQPLSGLRTSGSAPLLPCAKHGCCSPLKAERCWGPAAPAQPSCPALHGQAQGFQQQPWLAMEQLRQEAASVRTSLRLSSCGVSSAVGPVC